jgi:archaellin
LGNNTLAGQSPIDIRASDVDYSAMEQLHFVNYDKKGVVTVENTGHGG